MLNFPVEKPYDYKLVQAMCVLGRFPRELLPDVAGDAMVDGWEGRAVLALASFHPPNLSGIETAAATAFAEMGLPPMTRSRALSLVTRYFARWVAMGRLDPVEWCRDLGLYWRDEPRDSDLGELCALWVSYDDYPESRQKTLRSMMEKARSLCAGP